LQARRPADPHRFQYVDAADATPVGEAREALSDMPNGIASGHRVECDEVGQM
jgi:hypothetical protein